MPVDPASLRIVRYPAQILRAHAAPIPHVTDDVRAVARRMISLMYEAEGIGLAATQVGLPWRLFVADIRPDKGRSAGSDPATATDGPRVYINPVLSDPVGAPVASEEGCLSLPDIRGDVVRPEGITVNAIDVEGQPFTTRAAGLLARCLQHEFDHLDGILIIDRMVQLSRLKNRAAVRSLERDPPNGA